MTNDAIRSYRTSIWMYYEFCRLAFTGQKDDRGTNPDSGSD